MNGESMPEQGSVRAAADVVGALAVALRIPLQLAEEELHAVCYFGRAVASAVAATTGDWLGEMPYCFSYGASGGPFAKAVQEAIRELEARAWISVDTTSGAGPGSRLCSLAMTDDVLPEDLEGLAPDPAMGVAYIQAAVGAAALRPLPLVMNAIYSEPSLAEARSQGMRTGLPLPADGLNATVREVLSALRERPKEWQSADTLVPVLVDLLISQDQ